MNKLDAISNPLFQPATELATTAPLDVDVPDLQLSMDTLLLPRSSVPALDPTRVVNKAERSISKSLVQIGLIIFALFIFLRSCLFDQHTHYPAILFGRQAVEESLLLGDNPPTQEIWIDAVLNHYGIREGKDASSLLIPLLLPLEDGKYTYYCALQRKIAELIPEESRRPTIDLELRGHATSEESATTSAILGGVGPLSDAELLEHLMHDLNRKNVNLSMIKINLFSSPPPRTFLDQLINLPRYLVNLFGFLNQDHQKIYIASNTAHLNYDKIKLMGRDNVENLTERVAQKILGGQTVQPKKVFIVGTTQGWKKQLYPHIFERYNLGYISAGDAEQPRIQAIIDEAKMGQLADTSPNELFTLIKNKIQPQGEDSGITHLLLGCTELPMALHTKMAELGALGVEIVDTKAAFVALISEDIQNSEPAESSLLSM